MGAISPGPVVATMVADWPANKLAQARAAGRLLEPDEVAEGILFKFTRPRAMTILDVATMSDHCDPWGV